MRAGILFIVLLAAAAHQAACQVTLSTRLAQLKQLAGNVGLAQADRPTPKFWGYFATFGPGIGCMLSTVVESPKRDPVTHEITAKMEYNTAVIIAVSQSGFKITTNGFTCKFRKSDYVITPSQMQYYMQIFNNSGLPKELYTMPSSFSSVKDKVKCTYSLYSQTGYNKTGIFCPDCPEVSYDLGNVQWHYDEPASALLLPSQASISCKVDRSLLNSQDTMFRQFSNDGCFPAWAKVQTPSGPKTMAELSVGDKVLAVHPTTGQAFYDDVYLVPHKDAETAVTYLNIQASVVEGSNKLASRVLTVSPAHYVPTACGGEGKQQQCLKYARDVAAGNMVWLVEGSQAVLARVDQVVPSTEQGLYSPWTLSGSIVVDGVAASTHTAWPGEPTLLQLLPKAYVTPAQHYLAKAHQLVQAPLRMGYTAFGVKPLEVLDSMIYSVMEAGAGAKASTAAAAAAAARMVAAGVTCARA